MFKMIGGDGREYGPVTADQLREWIAEHRANAQTLVQPEGRTDWVPLGSLAEFAEALAAGTGGSPPPTSGLPEVVAAPTSIPTATETAVVRTLDPMACLGRAWVTLREHFPSIAGASLLVWVVQVGTALLWCPGAVMSLLISGPLYAGLCVLVLRHVRGQPAGMADLFSCFGPRLFPVVAVWVVTQIVTELGLVCCVLPGIFLKTAWAFALALVADRGLRAMDALGASWRNVLPQFPRVLALLALAFLPVVVFSVYAMVSMGIYSFQLFGPLATLNPADLMGKMEELLPHAARLGFQQQFVLLLNLPFAYTALITAYDELFGERRATAA